MAARYRASLPSTSEAGVKPVVLIIDGDDTLWDNNVYFEQAIEDFIDFLRPSSLSREQVRAVLDEIELHSSRVRGYGSAAFARNLRDCYERLAERDLRPEDMDHVMALGERIGRQPVRLLPKVAETVAYLANRHRLILFTKGQPEEQHRKVQGSGLAERFGHVAVVKEKDADAFRLLVLEQDLDPSRTWMIGNSPKSDINPALAAGIGAVYIPHPHTWRLETEPLPNPSNQSGRLLILDQFADLPQHF